MAYGYCGKILRVDLTSGALSVEEPPDGFYRTYLGGAGFVGYYLLKEVPAGTDPLGPDNRLIFAAGPLTGSPVGGTGRNCVGAKSPLTGGYGAAEVGGYWGAELKYAGFDAIVVHGRAERPVYLFVQDGHAELRDAGHLWGKDSLAVQGLVREELGDKAARTACIGAAGERLVRYANIANDVSHFAGRGGLGAVMGAKKLKAIVVRGHRRPEMADAGRLKEFAQLLARDYASSLQLFHDDGTASLLGYLNRNGGLPTNNFRQGHFDMAAEISGEAMTRTILSGRGSCFVCPVRCKREVGFVDEGLAVDARYGGPEYETVAAFGSNCGLADLKAIAKANELCASYGMDTISCGASIAFAIECFQAGLLTTEDTEGLTLRPGDPAVVVELVKQIGERSGIGRLLGEGTRSAAECIGRDAWRFAMHVKGQELPMHEPRLKQGLGLGYCVSPTGADHNHNVHDTSYRRQGTALKSMQPLGILDPLPLDDLGPSKVRLLVYGSALAQLRNSLVMCDFEPYDIVDLAEITHAATGWRTGTWELQKVGERVITMARVFNIREGFGRKDDMLPRGFFQPFESGPLAGVSIDPGKLDEALSTYYEMMGWDRSEGRPLPSKLAELGLDWVGE